MKAGEKLWCWELELELELEDGNVCSCELCFYGSFEVCTCEDGSL